jgi:hypothetical protein
VVKAASRALERADVSIILAYVPEEAESEVVSAFNKVMAVRGAGDIAAEVADEWFFETVVRLHRAGEGAPFTGLRPAGLGHGPVVPVAEKAIEAGDVTELAELLSSALRDEVMRKFGVVMGLKGGGRTSVAEDREYVEAMLGFIVWSHKTHACIESDPLHDHGSAHHHE